MKKYITILLSFALIFSSTCLFSCGYKYEKYHIEENIIGKTNVSDKELCAYFFALEDGSALLDLCNTDGETVQSLSFPESGDHYAFLDFEFAFENAVFQDMNFDGEDDLYVPCSVTTENLEGMAWLWDSDKGQFTLSDELSALYELTVYPEEELICSQDYSDPAAILCKEFKWEDGKLTQVGEYTINMD